MVVPSVEDFQFGVLEAERLPRRSLRQRFFPKVPASLASPKNGEEVAKVDRLYVSRRKHFHPHSWLARTDREVRRVPIKEPGDGSAQHLDPVEPMIEDFGRGVVITPAITPYEQSRREKLRGATATYPEHKQAKIPAGKTSPGGVGEPLKLRLGNAPRYWITEDGKVHNAGDDHNRKAQSLGVQDLGDAYQPYESAAIQNGWIRVTPGELDVAELNDNTVALIEALARDERNDRYFGNGVVKIHVRRGGSFGSIIISLQAIRNGDLSKYL